MQSDSRSTSFSLAEHQACQTAELSANLECPPPPDLTPHITRLKNQYSAGGSFGDVYKCQCRDGPVLMEVAVKAFRFCFTIDGESGDNSAKMLRRELGIWRRLKHKNIVPFLGVAHGFGMDGTVSLVSLWMPNQSIHGFLTNYDANLRLEHRLRILLDIASGLQYLHSFPIVHGDLNCNNVLLDGDYSARLADFGYSSLVGSIPEALAYLHRSTTRPGALRWIAPEQVDPEETFHRTTKSDIYSFGCIALQVLSGKQPWSEVREDSAVVLRLAKGHRPGRPNSRPIDDAHWNLIQACWSPLEERPAAESIMFTVQCFLEEYPSFPPLRDMFLSTSTEVDVSPDPLASMSSQLPSIYTNLWPRHSWNQQSLSGPSGALQATLASDLSQDRTALGSVDPAWGVPVRYPDQFKEGDNNPTSTPRPNGGYNGGGPWNTDNNDFMVSTGLAISSSQHQPLHHLSDRRRPGLIDPAPLPNGWPDFMSATLRYIDTMDHPVSSSKDRREKSHYRRSKAPSPTTPPPRELPPDWSISQSYPIQSMNVASTWQPRQQRLAHDPFISDPPLPTTSVYDSLSFYPPVPDASITYPGPAGPSFGSSSERAFLGLKSALPLPTMGACDSPSSFHPPGPAVLKIYPEITRPPSGNSHKRAFPGRDGPQIEGLRRGSNSGFPGSGGYDTRHDPSQRITVLERCTDVYPEPVESSPGERPVDDVQKPTPGSPGSGDREYSTNSRPHSGRFTVLELELDSHADWQTTEFDYILRTS